MPWRCPACQTPIEHSHSEDRPRPNTAYRCHVCRLELVLDVNTEKLTVVPVRSDEPEKKARKTR